MVCTKHYWLLGNFDAGWPLSHTMVFGDVVNTAGPDVQSTHACVGANVTLLHHLHVKGLQDLLPRYVVSQTGKNPPQPTYAWSYRASWDQLKLKTGMACKACK